MSGSVTGPWPVTHSASAATPDKRKQRRTWQAATPHKVESPRDDVPSLQITHFTKKQIVCFDVVRLGKSRKQLLKLVNPHDYPQTVELERISPKKGFFLNDKFWEIPPNEELLVPIFWTPPEEGSFRDLITFLCEGAFRLQVILLGTAQDSSKKASGRRSTFLVKRKSIAKPLRTQNGPAQTRKPKRHSLQTTPKAVGKENFLMTDDSLPKVNLISGTQRETMVFKKDGNCGVSPKSIGEQKDKSRDVNTEIEPTFDHHTTCSALRELQHAVEPVQNVPVQNVARETLLVCEGMSPLLQSKKTKARTKWNAMTDTPKQRNPSGGSVRELKGTEVKVHHPLESDRNFHLVEKSKQTLFPDAEGSDRLDRTQQGRNDEQKSGGRGNRLGNRGNGDGEMETIRGPKEDGIKDECNKEEESIISDDSLEARSDEKQDTRDMMSMSPLPHFRVESPVQLAGGLVDGKQCFDKESQNLTDEQNVKEAPNRGTEAGGEVVEGNCIVTVLNGDEGCKVEAEGESMEPSFIAEEGEYARDVATGDGDTRDLGHEHPEGKAMITDELQDVEVQAGEVDKESSRDTKDDTKDSAELSLSPEKGIRLADSNSPSSTVTENAGDVNDGDVEGKNGGEGKQRDDSENHQDNVSGGEANSQGLLFIPLDENTCKSKKRPSEEDGSNLAETKKLKTLNRAGSKERKEMNGRKSSLSLNRTVALRRAAATNGSVTGGGRAKPKAKKAMKGVPMAKLNLLKSAKTALPRHPMPFAAKNMFYDERWIDKQERGFVQWLNYILTPEEEGATNPTISGKKIEASALAVSSSSSTTAVRPAPTKEALSMRAYTARRRLNQLRRGACMLFQSEPVVRVIQQVEAQVEKGGLTVRTDRKIHADLGMKQKILMMILSYNPLWLRIGLETIYGELLPIEDNSDGIGLSRFIVTRLLGNPDIAEQFAHPTVPGLFGPGYEMTLAKFTLKKFLLLVFFLDKAKLTRLIDHNPCLFCKDAQYKSSRDLLLEFSRLYLKGEGDITRHLNYIGYSVTHIQKALDEFDFAVVNLAKDLRDGIRLVRVTELLTKNWLLSHELRCPAISRLQKVHNVQVALDALKTCTEVSNSGIDAKAIVDGHREKTLQLLWCIIFAFKVETMLDENQLKEETSFLLKNLKLRQKLDAVTFLAEKKTKRQEVADVYFKSTKLSSLLKWCQAVCSYYGVQVDNFTVSFCDGRAFCYLVHHYHPELIPVSAIRDQTTQTEALREETDSNDEDTFDGTWSSRSFSPTCGKESSFDSLKKNEGENFKTLYHAVKSLGGVPFMIKSADMSGTIPDEKVVITYVSYLCARLLDLCNETRAVRTIQTAWRSHQLKKKIKEREVKSKAAIVIQRRVRAYLLERKLRQRLSAVVCLQTAVRGWLSRKKVEALKMKKLAEQQTAAAIILQSHLRRYLAQRALAVRLGAVVKLQAFARGLKVRKEQQKVKKAVLAIEEFYKSHLQMKRDQEHYQQTRRAVIVMQAYTRGLQARRHYRRMKAAQKIQATLRGWRARRRYLAERKAATIVQSAWRMHHQRQHYQRVLAAARLIQARYRAVLLGRRERATYVSKCESALMIQSVFRGHRARKMYSQERRRCILLQSLIRRHIRRKRFLRLRKSALLIQRRYRATVLGRCESESYQLKRSNVIKLQGLVRGWLVRKELKEKEKAVCILQALVRGRRQQKRFNEMKKACVLLQSHVRSIQARRKYLQAREATLVFQKIYRGQQARIRVRRIRSAIVIQATWKMHKAKCEYRDTVTNVIKCQSAVRRFIQRRKYNNVVNAASMIQKHFRGWQEMKECQLRYATMRYSAITIQRMYRGYIARRSYACTLNQITLCQSFVRTYLEMRRFKKKRNAVLVIQEHYRAHRLMRAQLDAYNRVKEACVIVQALYRGHICRKWYSLYREAVVAVQSHRRMVVAVRRYREVKEASVIIQTRWRATMEARTLRQDYLKMKSAAIVLQSAYRGLQSRKYVAYLRKVVLCQSLVRRYLTRQKYTEQKYAAIKVQAHFRGHLARTRYTKQKRAATIIQRRWRAVLIGREEHLQYHIQRGAVITIQSTVRTWLVRREFVRTKKSAVLIQAAYRRHRAEVLYHSQRAAVTVLQVHLRAVLKGKEVRKNYLKIRESAVLVQSWWRMKYQRARYTKLRRAAVSIQAAYRGHRALQAYRTHRSAVCTLQMYTRTYLEGKAVKAHYLMMRRSAVIVQSWWRMTQCERHYKSKQVAATTIQAAFRRHRAHGAYKKLRYATITLQRFARAHLESKVIRAEYVKKRQSSIIVQSWWRMVREERCYKRKKMAAVTIQTLYRRHRAVTAYKTHKHAVLTLQRYMRAYLEGLVIKRQFQEKRRSAISIQSWWRMLQQRKQYQQERNAAIAIQATVRMAIQMKKYLRDRSAIITAQRRLRANQLASVERTRYLATRISVITLQAAVRGLAVRRQVHLWHESATKIIALWKGYKQRKIYLSILGAVRTVQSHYRALTAMKKDRNLYQNLRKSAITIQSYARVLQAKRMVERERAARLIQATYRMHRAHQEYLRMRRSAVLIQASVRGHRCRARYLNILRAVELLQKHTRAYLVGCHVREEQARRQRAASVIQSHYRRHVCRREFLWQRDAATKLQTWYRCRREQRCYLRMKEAAITLQRLWRSHQIMKADFRRYHTMRGAMITIQAQVRCHLLHQRYLGLRASTIIIQKFWRSYKARKDYRKKQNAVVCLQRRWRARTEGHKERSLYLYTKQKVVLMQSMIRARLCRRHFLKQKMAASVIQAWLRGHKCRQDYEKVKVAVKTIQRYWRAKMLANDLRESYLKMRSQVVLIQSLHRSQQCRRDYILKRAAIITIQARVKGYQCRKRYIRIKEAAMVIQKYWMARKLANACRSKFVATKEAAVSVQSAYRAYRCRQNYLRMKSAAVLIQAWFRGKKSLQEFRTTRNATVAIQRWYRNVLLTRRINAQHKEMSLAAVKMQSIWRGRLARKRVALLRWEIEVAKERMGALLKIQRWTRSRLQRTRYLRLRSATLTVQRIYKKRYQQRTESALVLQSYARMWLAKKRVRDMQSAALTLQSAWRGRRVRKANKDKKIAKARVRCKRATKAATEDKRLCNRTTSALHFLLTYKHLHQVVEAVSSLEVATRLSSRCCERLVAGQAVPVLFCLIQNCNRSLPCMEVIKHTVATLTNLAKYHVTAPSVLDHTDSVASVLDLMMIYRETNTVIATKATMLLTVLAQDHDLKKVITTTPKVEDKLRSLLHLQERKQKLKTRQMIAKSKSKGLSMNQSSLTTPSKRPRPPKTFQPDWILGRHKRKDIDDPLEALKCLMSSLSIK